MSNSLGWLFWIYVVGVPAIVSRLLHVVSFDTPIWSIFDVGGVIFGRDGQTLHITAEVMGKDVRKRGNVRPRDFDVRFQPPGPLDGIVDLFRPVRRTDDDQTSLFTAPSSNSNALLTTAFQ